MSAPLTATVRHLIGLPGPVRRVAVQRDIPVPMPDGVRLLADRYYPVDDQHAPLVLIRTLYGRRQAYAVLARIIAEQGFQVFQQSLRGTADSGGGFDGFVVEPGDGPATVAWLRTQPWFPAAMATWGTSYLGYVQWELAQQPIPQWQAAIIQDAPSEFYHSFMYPGGVFALGNALGWVQVVHEMFRTGGSLPRQLVGALTGPQKLRRAVLAPAIGDADLVAVGEHVPYFQQWLRHPEPDEYWARMDHRRNVENMPPTVLLAGGWYDFFLPGMLEDYAALRAAGRQVRLLVGPWAHGRGMHTRTYLRESFAVLEHALRGKGKLPADPVRVNVTGAKRWVDLLDWPPPGCAPRPWYVHADGGLDTRMPVASSPSRYRYDAAYPTPSVGGAVVAVNSGPKDNRRLESRPDVLVFTSPVLDRELEIVGPVTAEIHLRSSRSHTDVFARLCDVAPSGRSENLCDGIVRLNGPPGADGVRVARVELWPIAHRFRRGHRVRLQVSSGAHPRYARNPGTGDPFGTDLLAADQEVFHDPGHASAVFLPQRSDHAAERTR
ncbi:CocE/NonD family hydrolase [Saccharopolyspora sp. K220]|uniref:CocE/NonD family hydrolase n=1 Tax=Saccharopolyspora soli TaxID=2926618 RepID=UPI001F5AD77E|nr:CocE/NonD family hydrolase [Saccharopolyspora soli]MCI2423124.1 CocE/NonD family hydrolase [Saccharopolyspora soli]